MPTIKLDKKIVDFVRRIRKSKKYGDGTMAGVVAFGIRFFRHKHEECFSCQYHKEHIAGLELGRQKLALDNLHSTVQNDVDGDWVVIKRTEHDLLSKLALTYRRTSKQVAEQAVLEHVTRPPQCSTCPFYKEMCSSVKKREHKSAVISEPDGLDIRAKQDPAQEAS